MFVEALKYPTEDEDYFRTLAIGSLLVVASILIVPIFMLMGYVTRAVRNASNNEPAPQFGDYTGLLVDGLKLSAVYIVYFIGFAALMAVTAVAGEINETLAGIMFLTVLAPAYIGLAYISPSVLYHFSRRRKMKGAFQLRKIVDTSFSLRYLKAVILLLVIVPLMFSVLQVMLAATIIGILLIPTSFTYEIIVYSKLVGEFEP